MLSAKWTVGNTAGVALHVHVYIDLESRSLLATSYGIPRLKHAFILKYHDGKH